MQVCSLYFLDKLLITTKLVTSFLLLRYTFGFQGHTMSDLFRDTAAGNLIRLFSKNKFLRYPEEVPGFAFPKPAPDDTSSERTDKPTSTAEPPTTRTNGVENLRRGAKSEGNTTSSAVIEAYGVLERLAHDSALQPTTSQVILPVKTKEGIILVDWYSTGWALHRYLISNVDLTRRTDDPANPLNWSTKKKILVCTEIW